MGRAFLLLVFLLLLAAAVSAGAEGAQAGGRNSKLLRGVDVDGNGMISRAEAKASPALFADFDRIDANRDGQITPDELRAWNRGQAGGKRRDGLQQQFSAADADGDGRLSRAESAIALPRVARHFDAIDTDRDGAVTIAELRAYTQARRATRRPQSH